MRAESRRRENKLAEGGKRQMDDRCEGNKEKENRGRIVSLTLFRKTNNRRTLRSEKEKDSEAQRS